MTARRASMTAVGLTVLAVGVMLVLVMFAARSGPDRIFAGPLHDPSVRPITPSIRTVTCPPSAAPSASSAPANQNVSPFCAVRFHHGGDIHPSTFYEVIAWIFRIAALLILLAVLYVGARFLLSYLRERGRPSRRTGPAHVEFDVLDDPEPLREEMRQDADEQFALLMGGHPRNAIVAAWDRFEEQAERVNAARRPWETSSEFTLRLLEAVSADADAVGRLESLYREARFSEHEILESHRQAAVEALRSIHASLGIGAGAR